MTAEYLLNLLVPHVFTLLGVVIWPALILTIALLFRREVANFINRITDGEFWGAKVKAPTQTKAEVRELNRIEPKLGMPVLSDTPASLAPKSLPPLISGAGHAMYDKVEESIRNDPRIRNLSDPDKVNVLVSAQAVVQSHVVFERLYRLIFGSQLHALRLADRPTGIPLADVERIFDSAKASFSEFHKDRTFAQWCQFLIDTGLAHELPKQGSTRMAGVTELGHHFILYVTDARYAEPYG